MILVDTSVWVDHLRKSSARLSSLLDREQVLTHPFVIGEIACGILQDRRTTLELLAELPSVPVALDSEVLDLIERRSLAGSGVGFVDVHLLASAILANARIWTVDRKLARAAAKLRVAFAGDA